LRVVLSGAINIAHAYYSGIGVAVPSGERGKLPLAGVAGGRCESRASYRSAAVRY